MYNNKMSAVGYDQFVCDIFVNWEDVKDEILLPERKTGSGNGTVHVFLGAADKELRKEFPKYYEAVENGEETSVGAVPVTHFFMKSNIVSMLGYVCEYYKKKNEDFAHVISDILLNVDDVKTENGLLTTTSFLKLSIGSNKLRPYFKQFEDKGVFFKVIRHLLLPESAYKIALYKNSKGEYAAFWLIGFDTLDNFEANSTKEYIKKPIVQSEKESLPLQQIYYGAPGTGKSHTIKVQTKGEDVVRTTFHPDSDYSTFVGAYKPTTKSVPVTTVIGTKAVTVEGTDGEPMTEEKIVYEFVSQSFLQAYVSAWKKQSEAQPKKQYLVVEEINRGNCAQIFGDLFQLLDRNDYGFSDYPIKADADMKKHLQKAFEGVEVANRENINAMFEDEDDIVAQVLNGDILLLPDNLYIWATMNTSDQSLFPIDSAFKRRWDWQYVPISDAGEHWVIKTNGKRYSWWRFLEAINKRIYEATYSEDKKLGYFFCKAKDGVINAETFVGKVVFYLWNDVFKDTEFEGDAFKDTDDTKLSFDKFYTVEGDKTKVVDEKIDTFLTNLGLVAMIDDEDIDVYVGQEESPSNGADQSTWTTAQRTNYNYWNEFLTYAQGNDEFQKYFSGVKSPNKDNWKSFAIGEKTFYLSTLLRQKQKEVKVQIYIPEDQSTYNNFLANKEAIEAEMGTTFNWNEFPQYKCFTIDEAKTGVDLSNQESRIESFEFLIDRLLRMREVFPKYK